jgi:Omp85 superfamily domain
MKKALITKLLVGLALLLPLQASAQVVALDEGQSLFEKRSGWLPYIFSTDSLGFAVGAGAFTAGTIQPQASLFGTAFVTSNESALLSGSLNNYRFGKDSRFFMDAFLLVDHFTDQRFYAGPAVIPGETAPGTNDSNEEAYVTGVSNDVTFEANFKYRLPIGNLKDDPIAVYHLKEGLVESGPQGGEVWNPKTSGQTTLGARYFYTYRDLTDTVFNQLDNDATDDLLTAKTNGFDFWLEYDNTDFPRNPERGSRQVFNIYRDFGWLNSDESWTNLQGDFSKYFNLGGSDWFKQNVLALNFWTANTPTWDETDGGTEHRPPPNYGSELGGFDRMRAYPSGRFHDKSAVYYAAEWRLMPQTQPLKNIPLLNYFQIDWWQVAPFIEAGRVGPDYDADLFFKDLKWDVGVGLRLMAFRAVVRLDFAVGEEGAAAWAMISQPFSRQGR